MYLTLLALFLFIYLFEARPYSVAQTTLKFVAVFFPQPPEYRICTQTEGNREFEFCFACMSPFVSTSQFHHFGCICMTDAFLILVGGDLFAGLSFMGHN